MPLGANKSAIIGMGGVSAGDVVLIDTYTAGGEASKAYTGFSSDYKQLVWQFVNLHGSADNTNWSFQVKTSGGSYGISTISQAMRCMNTQDGSSQSVDYWSDADVLESTGQVPLYYDSNFDDAEFAVSGQLTLYNPTSSTYYKNWITRGVGNLQGSGDALMGAFISGYVLTATALDGIEFKFDSATANIDTGKILYWGIK